MSAPQDHLAAPPPSPMYDLHCHSILSDGELLPEEFLRRVEVLGYRYLAITDHVGPSNLEPVLEGLTRAAEAVNPFLSCRLIPGLELTHTPPRLIPALVEKARSLGAKWVVVHGETIVEPVAPGTNRAALEAGVDLLAHPGLIGPEEVALAAKNGVILELSARKGHCLANGRLVGLALAAGATLTVNSDAHSPSDILSADLARQVALGAGLTEAQYDRFRQDVARRLAELAG